MIPSMKLLVFFIAMSLVGCYPTYNWRLIQTEQFGWQALFPAKPNRNARTIIIPNQSPERVININRYSVVLDDMNFVLDIMNYEGEIPGSISSLEKYITETLKNNFNIPINAEVTDGLEINGFAGSDKKPVVLVLKHKKSRISLVRGAVIATPKNFDSEKAEFFLKSIN